MSSQIKVLHVTECLGGGVTSALRSYIESTPEFEHHVVGFSRRGDETGEERDLPAVSVKIMPRSLRGFVAFASECKAAAADVFHIHSTYAGVFARALALAEPRRTVYTPHGFSFLRNEHPIRLALYHAVEKVLAHRTGFIAACGEQEASLAQTLVPPARVARLVNVTLLPVKVPRLLEDTGAPIRVGMLGRICEQKGADFFAEVAERVGASASFVWIGGGDATLERRLKRAGVEVSGWRERRDALELLAGLDVYFHSAAWDGFPMSVLEAAAFGLPLVLRSIPPFEMEQLATVRNTTGASGVIVDLARRDRVALARALANTARVTRTHAPSGLASSLRKVYFEAAGV